MDSTSAEITALPPKEVTQTKASSALAATWTYRNMMFPNNGAGQIRLGSSPALAVHNGSLWCLWVSNSGALYYSVGDNQTWSNPTKFAGNFFTGLVPETSRFGPAVADFNGILHAVFVEDTNSYLVHYQYDDYTKTWGKRCIIGESKAAPSLCSFNNRLYCALGGNRDRLKWTAWDPMNGWLPSMLVNESSWGCPALYVLNGQLHMLFSENDSGRKIDDIVLDASYLWRRVSRPPESTAFGVTAASALDSAFMAFQENANSGDVYVSVNNGTTWLNHESTGQKSADTPAVVVLNDIVTCVFDARNNARDLLWCQRPLTQYATTNWMEHLDGNKYISEFSIPGTHDSCAISNVPFVGTQRMTIVQQLNAGIRYFDLRCGLIRNSLYMFHGGYQLYPPAGLLLLTVITDIYVWLNAHPKEAVIVQIKEDNPPSNSTVSFAGAVRSLISPDPGRWNLGKNLPRLNDVKGKIQLFRRYVAAESWDQIGIDVTAWKDNSERFEIPTGDVTIVVQDRYAYDELPSTLVPRKFQAVSDLLDLAKGERNSKKMYINFTSVTATKPFLPSGVAVQPLDLAIGLWETLAQYVAGVNPRVRSKLRTIPRPANYGIVVMDYPELPDDDLAAYIINSNAFV